MNFSKSNKAKSISQKPLLSRSKAKSKTKLIPEVAIAAGGDLIANEAIKLAHSKAARWAESKAKGVLTSVYNEASSILTKNPKPGKKNTRSGRERVAHSGGQKHKVQEHQRPLKHGVTLSRGMPVPYTQGSLLQGATDSTQRVPSHGTSRAVLNSEVTTSVTFAIQGNLLVNPGYSTMGRWLSEMAHLYEQFQVGYMKFQYTPMCPADTTGQMFMFWDADYSDDLPATVEDVLNQENSISFAPWEAASVTINPKMFKSSKTNAKWVVKTDDEVASDRSTFGRFMFGSVGATTPQLCGVITMEYIFNFSVRQLHIAHGGGYLNLGTVGNTPPSTTYLTGATASPASTLTAYASWVGTVVTFDPGVTGHFIIIFSTQNWSGNVGYTPPALVYTGGIVQTLSFEEYNGTSVPQILSHAQSTSYSSNNHHMIVCGACHMNGSGGTVVLPPHIGTGNWKGQVKFIRVSFSQDESVGLLEGKSWISTLEVLPVLQKFRNAGHPTVLRGDKFLASLVNTLIDDHLMTKDDLEFGTPADMEDWMAPHKDFSSSHNKLQAFFDGRPAMLEYLKEIKMSNVQSSLRNTLVAVYLQYKNEGKVKVSLDKGYSSDESWTCEPEAIPIDPNDLSPANRKSTTVDLTSSQYSLFQSIANSISNKEAKEESKTA